MNKMHSSHKFAANIMVGDRFEYNGTVHTATAVTNRPGLRTQTVIIDTVEGVDVRVGNLYTLKMV